MAKQVGRYQIQERIGQGAMANVYRAYDPGIDRVLAIKVLKREFCRNTECAARFLREAKAAGALSHPNIVTIYDVGEIEGFPYIAMELLEGEPLDKVAQRVGSLPIGDVLEIGLQLTDALRYAHSQGVVHRDIKPSNIMLGADGRSIKILDFGIARVTEAGTSLSESNQLKTQIGQVLGTPRYMSPEQALGRELDGRSDLFSVGVVLYELITGRPAFTGSSAATLALQITQQEPSPIDSSPECPRGLKFIVGKLLAKRPEKRFETGKHLYDALQREKLAFDATLAEGRPRRLPLQLRLMLIIGAITAGTLTIGTGAVLNRQTEAMERVALASGSTIAAFVASNAALHAVDNATRLPHERDWLPVQAFINTAASDPNITQLLIVDADGFIRAASDDSMLGARYLEPVGQRLEREGASISVTSTRSSQGVESFRFSHPIVYSGRQFGTVDVSVRKTELQAASAISRLLLVGLGGLTLAIVMVLSFAAVRLVAEPIRRLRAAFRDAAAGDLDFRISHRRADEFGDLFDGFNAFVASMQERLDGDADGAPANLAATRIGPAANDVGFATRSAQQGQLA
ncbi:MAG: protein kinase [Hyphomonadaceae bacterium]